MSPPPGCALVLAAVTLAAGCGAQQPAKPPGDGGGDSAASIVDSGADAAADLAVSGLNARPANPTCHAPPAPVQVGTAGLPQTLSQTGCFEAGDATRPVAALIPYTVGAPLWSDGADKDRWLALPDGAHIHVGTDGDFALPPGTVLVKTFRLGSRRIETRFFVRHPDGAWSGYTYEWNQAGTDATLLDEGSHRRQLGDREWHFPSRPECDGCHTPEAGHSLGLEIAQLNRDLVYDGGRRANQLVTFAHIGLFDAPLSDDPRRLPVLTAPGDTTAALDARARAYLHANCSNCHRPEVGNSGTTDLRASTPLPATHSCNAPTLKGNLGHGAGVRLIVPGAPEQSMILLRMRALDSSRMPTAASLLVDDEGVALLTAWITALTGCP